MSARLRANPSYKYMSPLITRIRHHPPYSSGEGNLKYPLEQLIDQNHPGSCLHNAAYTAPVASMRSIGALSIHQRQQPNACAPDSLTERFDPNITYWSSAML